MTAGRPPERDLITFDGWSREELLEIVALARELKSGRSKGSLAGKVIALYFMNPSLRTRASCESACARLGARAVVLDAGAGGVWGLEHRDGVVMDGAAAEHVREAAPVLSRFADAIGVRSFPKLERWQDDKAEPVLSAFARHATVPVFSLEGSSRHPLQAFADAVTLLERLKEPRGKRFVLSWAPHPKPLPMCVPNSAIEAAALVGMDVVVAHPEGYALDADVIAGAERLARAGGGSLRATTDQAEAISGAAVVYGKSWGSLEHYGDPKAEAERRKGLGGWLVTSEKLERAQKDAFFMHCLPVRRDVEIAASVLDGPRSAVVDQAENRLHTAAALFLRLLDGHVTREDGDDAEGPLYA